MIEGWHNGLYLILFEEQADAIAMSERYGIHEQLRGFTIVGIRGWDDFIVRNSAGQFFTIPTVPMMAEHMERFDFKMNLAAIEPDEQLRGKIKWHVTPLIFGGDPASIENTAWISLDDHVNAVRWWNQKYREIKEAEQTMDGNRE